MVAFDANSCFTFLSGSFLKNNCALISQTARSLQAGLQRAMAKVDVPE